MAQTKKMMRHALTMLTASTVAVGSAVVVPTAAYAYTYSINGSTQNVVPGQTIVQPINYSYDPGVEFVSEDGSTHTLAINGATGTNVLGQTYSVKHIANRFDVYNPTSSHVTKESIAAGTDKANQQDGGWYMFYANTRDQDNCVSDTIKENAAQGKGTFCATIRQEITFDDGAVNPVLSLRSGSGTFSADPNLTDNVDGKTVAKTWPRDIRVVSIDGVAATSDKLTWTPNDPTHQDNILYTEVTDNGTGVRWTDEKFIAYKYGYPQGVNEPSANQPYVTFNGSPKTVVMEWDMYVIPNHDVNNPDEVPTYDGKPHDWGYGYATTPAGFWFNAAVSDLKLEKSVSLLDNSGNATATNDELLAATAGTKARWTVKVTNVSDQDNYGFAIKDLIPAGFKAEKVTLADGSEAKDCTLSGNNVSCRKAPEGYQVDENGKLVDPNATTSAVPAALAGGASWTINIDGEFLGKDVVNNATVVSPYDKDPSNNSDKAELRTPGVKVIKTSDPASGVAVADGEEITYTLTFRNDGTGESEIDFVDNLADILKHGSVVQAPESINGLNVSYKDGVSAFRVTGKLAAGDVKTLTYKVKMADKDSIKGDDKTVENFVYPNNPVTPNDPSDPEPFDPNGPNTTPPTPPANGEDAKCEDAQVSCTSNPLGEGSLLVTKTSNKLLKTLAEGEEVTYTLTYRNTGKTAAEVDSVDNMADVLKHADVTVAPASDNGLNVSFKEGVSAFRVSGTIEPGQFKTVTYTVKVKKGAYTEEDSKMVNFLVPNNPATPNDPTDPEPFDPNEGPNTDTPPTPPADGDDSKCAEAGYACVTNPLEPGETPVVPPAPTEDGSAKRCFANAFALNSPIMWLLPLGLMAVIGAPLSRQLNQLGAQAGADLNNNVFAKMAQEAKRQSDELTRGWGSSGNNNRNNQYSFQEAEWMRNLRNQFAGVGENFNRIIAANEGAFQAMAVVALGAAVIAMGAQACKPEGFAGWGIPDNSSKN